jgi:hypothetical protein
MELWKLFASYCRVGEVYVPNKLDKRGNRFGFVKYKDIGDVEEFSRKLDDVWFGSFKIRINLSRYGCKGLNTPNDEVHCLEKGQNVRTTGGAAVIKNRSFRSALVEPAVVSKHPDEAQPIPTLETDVEVDFLQTLIGSYVGRLRRGVELKALQMKLGLAGLNVVKAIDMGGNMVLLSRGPEAEVGLPACNLKWWKGYLEELKPWSPNQVCQTRRVWIRMHGIPLHA